MKVQQKIKAVKSEKSYGHLRLNSTELPMLAKKSIGEECELEIKVKVKALRAPDMWEVQEKVAKPGDVFADVSIIEVKEYSEKSKK